MTNIKYYRVRLESQLPSSSAQDGDLYFVRESGNFYLWDASNSSMRQIGGSPTVVWGGITGTLSNQADLEAALADLGSSIKISTSSPVTPPSPAYSGDLETADSMNPAMYIEDANGNWHTQGGIDTQSADAVNGPQLPAGTLTFTKRTYFRDTLTATQVFKNAFVSIAHQAGAGTSSENQDRALGLNMTNVTCSIYRFSITGNVVTLYMNFGVTTSIPRFRKGMEVVASGLAVGTYLNGVLFTILTAAPPVSGLQVITLSASGFTHADVVGTADAGKLDQSLYSMACLQAELDIVGTPTIKNEVDSELAACSLQVADSHLGNGGAPSYGATCLRAVFFREAGAGTWTSGPAGTGARIIVQNDSAVDGASTYMVGVEVQGIDYASPTNLGFIAFHVKQPSSGSLQWATGRRGLWIEDCGSRAQDYAIKVDGGKSLFAGPVWLSSLVSKTMLGTDSNGNIIDNSAALTTAIGAETTRAEAAESTLTTNLAAEVTRAEAAEATNATAISTEATTRAAADTTNATAISTETTRAEAAEAALALVDMGASAGTGYFFSAGLPGNAVLSGNNAVSPNGANEVTVFMFVLREKITIRKCTCTIGNGISTTGVAAFGIYDSGGNLLFQSNPFAATTANAGATLSVSLANGNVTLTPGVYYFAQAGNSASLTMAAVVGMTSTPLAQLTKNAARVGKAANALSGNALPSTLGTITTGTGGTMSLVLWES